MKYLLSTVALILALSAGASFAADDPTIRGELREGIQAAMSEFVDSQTVDGVYLHYDAVAGQLLELRLEELHAGIVKKGDFYVSCADFVDPAGGVVDLDFLVIQGETGLRVNQAIVHKSDGVKRPYQLESQ